MTGSDGEKHHVGWHVRTSAPDADEMAPDGSEVRHLARLGRASMAQFQLRAGAVSQAVQHRTIEEYWYIAAGQGQMWLNDGREQTVVELQPGLSLALAPKTSFQFRANEGQDLVAVGVAVPGWPGDDEAIQVDGHWPADT